ncbi:hypothetical protein MUK60_22785 [Streptomyces sp. LRE541]|uniref:hypothetical protein n=1 Tax=Streptomyces sp. LRE541 TaxID=2931983 RepID=UPI0020104686|nr:hypothetical protein [Streptomyces sp. LRE541]UPZ30359.1 hypothetical protein MUK60_22785 [Streptomyces sp. LRE541]
MSELPANEAPLEAQTPVEPPVEAEPDGSVAHPVPIDSPTTRYGDGGTPADSLPPPLGA